MAADTNETQWSVGRRELLIGGAGVVVLVVAAIFLFSSDPQPQEFDETTHTMLYTDGSVAVNNSHAVGSQGSAIFEKDMDIEVQDFHGHRIFREYTWIGLYKDDRFPEYSPPMEDGRVALDIARIINPANGVPEIYAGLSLEEDAEGAGYVKARFYFDEEYRSLVGDEAQVYWGTDLSESKPVDWADAEIQEGIYLATARDYNLSRHRKGYSPTNPYFAAGDIDFDQRRDIYPDMVFTGTGVLIQ